MVLGYHIILGAYGFWLPNDPRGSWSTFVRTWELRRFGPATKVETTRSVAGAAHNRMLRMEAKTALQFPPVRFNGMQARAIGRGFAKAALRSRLEIRACSVLPEHVHLVLGRHQLSAEQMMIALKGGATQQLLKEGIHPLSAIAKRGDRLPQVFARSGWKVFLDSPRDIERAIAYVENNPIKEGKPPQRWSFVTPCSRG